MHQPYQPGPVYADGPSIADRVRLAVLGLRDALDRGGRPMWLAAMIFGFVAAWPVGLGILAYLLWSKRMFGSCHARRHHRHHHHHEGWGDRRAWRQHAGTAPSTGNVAFDAYREETLKRLEDEHAEFLAFLGRLREARDKAEFDQFMQERAPRGPASPDATPQA